MSLPPGFDPRTRTYRDPPPPRPTDPWGWDLGGTVEDGLSEFLGQLLGPAWANVFDQRFAGGAKGDGVANDAPAFQAANDYLKEIGPGGVIFAPQPPVSYNFSAATPASAANAAVYLDSFVTVMGVGAASLITSSVVSSAANHGFAFFANRHWGTPGATTACGVVGVLLRRSVTLKGDEGPYDGGVEFNGVDRPWVDQVRVEGSMNGVVFIDCTNQGWGRIVGYRNGDSALKVDQTTVPSAIATQPGIAVAIESGYQLVGGGALPEPSGPVGSGHVLTQDNVDAGRLFSQDCRHQGLETGGGITDLNVDSYEGLVTIAGRSVRALLANYVVVKIGNALFRGEAAGTMGITAQGDGVAQVQRDLSVGTVVAVDVAANNAPAAVVLGRDVNRASVDSIDAYNMAALDVGRGGAALLGTEDVEIGRVYANNPPQFGAYFSGGSAGTPGPKRYHVGRLCVVDSQGLNANHKFNCGAVFDTLAAGILSVTSFYAEDTGGAKLAYGAYANACSVIMGETEIINPATAEFAVDGGGAVVLNSTGTGDPAGAHMGSPGSLFRRTDGGAGTSLYVKEGAALNAVGWAAK